MAFKLAALVAIGSAGVASAGASQPLCGDAGIACFSVQVVGDGMLADAVEPKGRSYGVSGNYTEGGKRLEANVWDSDGDLYVNMSGSHGYCIFDVGAQGNLYLNVKEMSGVQCHLALERTFEASPLPGFAYTLTMQPSELGFACKDDVCRQPAQLVVGSGCGESCEKACAATKEADPVSIQSCRAGCQFPFPMRTHQDFVDEYCSMLPLPKVDVQACSRAVAGFRQCMAPPEALAEAQAPRQQLRVAPPVCDSLSLGCFSLQVVGDGKLADAKEPAGYSFGVSGNYSADGKHLQASVQDSDGDLWVNVSGSAGYCVFDIGAQIDLYLRAKEMNGVQCHMALERTFAAKRGPGFAYVLRMKPSELGFACKGDACHQPAQPKVGSGCGESCEETCAAAEADPVALQSCRAGCQFPFAAQTHQDFVDEFCRSLPLPKADFQACLRAVDGFMQCMAPPEVERQVAAPRSQQEVAQPICGSSSLGCFSLQVVGDGKLADAKEPAGYSFGVSGNYSADGKQLQASVEDSDGDLWVNVSGSAGYCVFDIGAQIDLYLRAKEMKGVQCHVALERTFAAKRGPGFAYVLRMKPSELGFACKGDACRQPVQPQVGGGCGEFCEKSCAAAETDPVALQSCRAGCQFPFASMTHQDFVDEFCRSLPLPTADFQACVRAVDGFRQCMEPPEVERQVAAPRSKRQAAQPSCDSSSLGCFSLQLVGDGKLADAKEPAGYSYGVSGNYSVDGKHLQASVEDSDGDLWVNASGSTGYCVFDIGAQIDLYLNAKEMVGVQCRLALERTFPAERGPGFSYVLKMGPPQLGFACKGEACRQPVQPKVGSGCGESCEKACGGADESCRAGCRFSELVSDTVDEFCRALSLPRIDLQACSAAAARFQQCMDSSFATEASVVEAGESTVMIV